MLSMNHLKFVNIFALSLIFITGCSTLGKDNILFMTKTSLGVDVDTKPPTLEIGYDRKEGTISPTFQDGKVLSQVASFKTKDGIVGQAIGQSFATGQAADILSKYMFSPAKLATTATIDESEILLVNAQTAKVSGNEKRYFFGTDTNFGFKVNFGLETGGLPDSVHLGYKRKELAYVPLIANKDGEVALASLMATAGLSTKIASLEETSLTFSQFYATGLAANHLASIPEIRSQVTPNLFPKAAEAIETMSEQNAINKRVSNIYANVDLLDGPKSFDLNANPPVADNSAMKVILKNRDPDCERLENQSLRLANADCSNVLAGATGVAKTAKEMLKLRVEKSKNDEASLSAWEAAVKATL
ncbi:MAG: hypothetical protein HOJ49_00705 [Nitrospina sp.]|nr:hypothetical protein [Nitrospina sp.]